MSMIFAITFSIAIAYFFHITGDTEYVGPIAKWVIVLLPLLIAWSVISSV